MTIRRIVPIIPTREAEKSKEFYGKFLGLDTAMDMGWITTFSSRANPTAQVSIVKAGDTPIIRQTITIEVDDVDRLHSEAVAQGYNIVYPLSDEAWGVRRFGVEDPNGIYINLMTHIKKPEKT